MNWVRRANRFMDTTLSVPRYVIYYVVISFYTEFVEDVAEAGAGLAKIMLELFQWYLTILGD